MESQFSSGLWSVTEVRASVDSTRAHTLIGLGGFKKEDMMAGNELDGAETESSTKRAQSMK